MLEFKKISEDTVNIMMDAVCSCDAYYNLAVSNINNLIPSREMFVLNSANSCLLTVAESIPGPVLVCDMGGWNGFIRSCEVFDKKVEYLETNEGIVNIELLDDYLKNNIVKTFYITSLAGYTAPQPLKQIQELCDLYNVMLINDISGSVGNQTLTQYGDILVASTGSPKIVNIENGGFICQKNDKIKLNKHMLKSLKADNITCAGIANEIKKAPQILEKTVHMNSYLKEKLKQENIEVIHPEEYGLNTMIYAPSNSKAKKLAYNIRKQLNIAGNIITVGPNYNRIKRASVIIEIKNLNIDTLELSDLDNICSVIVTEFENI